MGVRINFRFGRSVGVGSSRFGLVSAGFPSFLLIFGSFRAFPFVFKEKINQKHHLQLQTSMKSALRPVSGSQWPFESRRRARWPSRMRFKGIKRYFLVFETKNTSRVSKPSNLEVSETMLVGRDRQKLSKREKTTFFPYENLCFGAVCQIWENHGFSDDLTLSSKWSKNDPKSSPDVFFS